MFDLSEADKGSNSTFGIDVSASAPRRGPLEIDEMAVSTPPRFEQNCQVGVCACLGRGEKAAIIDFRRYLPESWVGDEERCNRAMVPAEERTPRTKPQLVLEMVLHALDQGVKFSWVGGDEAYGNTPQLIAGIEVPAHTRLMDMSCTKQAWEKLPRPKDKAVTVNALVEQRFTGSGRDVPIRQTSQGPLRCLRGWLRRQGPPGGRSCLWCARKLTAEVPSTAIVNNNKRLREQCADE